MKTCFKCGVCQPLSAFYRHSGMADGHLNKCIACTKRDSLVHRHSNVEAVRAYDALQPIRFDGMQYRTDIGHRAVKR